MNFRTFRITSSFGLNFISGVSSTVRLMATEAGAGDISGLLEESFGV
jgi:hypothetical protein